MPLSRYASLLLNYLQDRDKEKFERLKKAGDLNWYLNHKAATAEKMYGDLISSGVQSDAAEEIVRADLLT